MAGNKSTMSFRMVRPDGTIRWLESRSFPVRDAEGRFIRVVGIAEDFTERKEKNAALRASEEQFRQLADNIHELFFVLAPEPFQVTYLSPAYDEIWGRSRQEVYDRPMAWVDSIHPDDRAVMAGIFARKAIQEEVTFRIMRPDGDDSPHSGSQLSGASTKPGELIRAVGVAEDITDPQGKRRMPLPRLT